MPTKSETKRTVLRSLIDKALSEMPSPVTSDNLESATALLVTIEELYFPELSSLDKSILDAQKSEAEIITEFTEQRKTRKGFMTRFFLAKQAITKIREAHTRSSPTGGTMSPSLPSSHWQSKSRFCIQIRPAASNFLLWEAG